MIEKAKIKVLEGPDKGDIELMFNPTDFPASVKNDEAGDGVNAQFRNTKLQDLPISLFFDTYEQQQDVRDITKKIVSLAKPAVDGKKTKRPPVCLFLWGSFSYRGVVSKVDQKFTMFLGTGIPVRAELTVTFRPYLEKEEDEKNKGKDACRKHWIVKSGERLDLIANETLKDPAGWRKIAAANHIANPLAFPTEDDIGRVLIIPD